MEAGEGEEEKIMIVDWEGAYLGNRSIVVQGLDVESRIAAGFLDARISHALSCISAQVHQEKQGVNGDRQHDGQAV
jgi:hypothetical protein